MDRVDVLGNKTCVLGGNKGGKECCLKFYSQVKIGNEWEKREGEKDMQKQKKQKDFPV